MPDKDIIDFLLKDKEGTGNQNFLEQKIRFLNETEKHYPTDDLAIIRLIVSEN